MPKKQSSPTKPDRDSTPKDPPMAKQVVIAGGKVSSELFTDQLEDAYSRVNLNGVCGNFRLNSREFKNLISKVIYDSIGRVPTSKALQEGLSVLEGKARFEGPKIELFKRVAWVDGELHYDMGGNSGHVAKITKDGWSVRVDSANRFKRTAQQLPQVMPSKNGDIKALLPFLRLDEKADRARVCLELCDLLVRYIPGIPQAIRQTHGPPRSAKTTRERLKKKLVDPSLSDVSILRTHRLDQVALQLSSEHMVVFDNVSGVTEECSDLLCIASTGGTHFRRKLWTDTEGITLDVACVPVLTNMTMPLRKGDAQDRAVSFECKRIPGDQLQEETVFLADFEKCRPVILVGIFDALVKMLKEYPELKVKSLPRMADYAMWGMAANKALGYGAQLFYDAYLGNRASQCRELIKSNTLAVVLIDLIEDKGSFRGNMAKLLDVLNRRRDAMGFSKNVKGWPKNPQVLSRNLTDLSHALDEFGIVSTMADKENRVYWIRKREVEEP